MVVVRPWREAVQDEKVALKEFTILLREYK